MSSSRSHPDPDVDRALVRLRDALCSWERSTGRTSLLVLREEGGLVIRAANGITLGDSGDDLADDWLVHVNAADTAAVVPVRTPAEMAEKMGVPLC